MQESWLEIKPDFTALIDPTSRKAEHFSERITLLEQLLEARVEAEAAWLVFRILLRERDLAMGVAPAPQRFKVRQELFVCVCAVALHVMRGVTRALVSAAGTWPVQVC